MTLIIAPAGFGKTSLLVSYASKITTEPIPYVDWITTNDLQQDIFRVGKVNFGEGSVE